MIAMIKGILVEVESEAIVLDVHGVGYELHCSNSSMMDVEAHKGESVLMYVYTHVREDALTLFGFSSRQEKSMFLSLLKVNGVGPKMALSILSGARVDRIAQMIEQSDAKGLSSLPKVGKKTAEQIILTLKGKLVVVEEERKNANRPHQEIVSALVNLGFKPQIVDEFVASLPAKTDLEEGVRKGLQALAGVL